MDGLLIVDKPAGMTSHDVVGRVRRATGERSVGHLGTLDPMATGVLPLLLGRYTRLAQFYGASAKHYSGTIRLGFATDTYDAEGEPVGEPAPVHATDDAIARAMAALTGDIEQTPPAFSAKKVGGVAAYKLARAEKSVELKAVPVRVERFVPRGRRGDNGELVDFEAEVSAGTYIRSLAHELGHRLGCGAHLAALRRTRSGDFTLGEALTLEALEELSREGTLAEHLPHPRTLLPALPSVTATPEAAGRIRNGGCVNLMDLSRAPLVKVFEGQRHLLAIARRVAGTLFQPKVVLG